MHDVVTGRMPEIQIYAMAGEQNDLKILERKCSKVGQALLLSRLDAASVP